MIVTQADARRVLAKHFPELRVRLTTRHTILVQPRALVACGWPTLVVRKLATGSASAVQIGRFVAGTGAVDWSWTDTPAEPRNRPPAAPTTTESCQQPRESTHE